MKIARFFFILLSLLIVASESRGQDPDQIRGRLEDAEFRSLLKQLRPETVNQTEAARAWNRLSQCEPDRLPEILAAFDQADPVTVNWLTSLADAIVQRARHENRRLPLDALQRFFQNTKKPPRARELVYDWLVADDPDRADRLLPTLLDDPNPSLRHQAVAYQLRLAQKKIEAKQTDAAIGLLHKTLDAARDPDQIGQIVALFEAQGEPLDLASTLGFLTRWNYVGPFDNRGENGFDQVYPPETAQEKITFRETYQGKPGPDGPNQSARECRWTEHETDDPMGKIDFNRLIGPEKGVIAYLAADIDSDGPRDVELRMGSFNALKIWANGRLVGRFPIYHAGAPMDGNTVPVRLRAGKNRILIKVCQNEQTQSWAQYWYVQVRLTDPTGKPLSEKKPFSSKFQMKKTTSSQR